MRYVGELEIQKEGGRIVVVIGMHFQSFIPLTCEFSYFDVFLAISKDQNTHLLALKGKLHT